MRCSHRASVERRNRFNSAGSGDSEFSRCAQQEVKRSAKNSFGKHLVGLGEDRVDSRKASRGLEIVDESSGLQGESTCPFSSFLTCEFEACVMRVSREYS